MKAPAAAAIVVLAHAVAALKVTPIQKVLEMMEELKAKGIEEMDKEAKIFKEYTEWVDDEAWKLSTEMKTAAEDISELETVIEKSLGDVEELKATIGELEGDVDAVEADMKEATELRTSQKADFQGIEKDYSESLDAIDRAITTLEAQPGSVPQAELLLQQLTGTVPAMDRVLTAVLQVKGETAGSPAVAAYESSSGTVIDMLEKLKVKFRKELDDVQTEEANRRHNHDLAMLHMGDAVARSTADAKEKTLTKTKLAASVGEAKGKLEDTKNELLEDKKMLSEVKATHNIKLESFKQNQKIRKEEVEAIEKAIEIISSPAVSGLAQVSPIQKMVDGPQGITLLQRSSSSRRADLKGKASSYLQSRANALSSAKLAALASQMAGSPFDGVVRMIQELIAKLQEEASAEADHHAWCDKELKKNKLKRETKSEEAAKLSATIEVLQSSIETMGEKVATLSKEEMELSKAMAEATNQRQEEKADNGVTIKDAKQAQAAVQVALKVLRDFYSVQESLLQRRRQVPDMAEYKGMQGGKAGIIGMLEVILSDFARLEADTTSEERQAAQEYSSFMKSAKKDKEAKHSEGFKLKLAKDKAEFDKAEATDDLENVQEELGQANKYFGELKPSCLEVHVSYEERVAKRREEVEALKEAYGILDAESPPATTLLQSYR